MDAGREPLQQSRTFSRSLPNFEIVDTSSMHSVTATNTGRAGRAALTAHDTVPAGNVAGTYYGIVLTLALRRYYGFFVLRFYVPAYLAVLVGYAPLWLPTGEAGVRVGLHALSLYLYMTLVRSLALADQP